MRDLTYEISVRGAEQAEAQVARVEQRLVAAGKAGEQASRGIDKFEQSSQRATTVVATTDRATAALQQSAQIATRSIDGLTASTNATATAATKAAQSMYEEARALIQADVATSQMATTTDTATVAQTGLLTQVSAGIAKFAPYAIAAQIVTTALVDWYQAHEEAAVAAETLAAKQDTIARASQIAGVQIRTYAEAVKYLNEHFARTPAFVDHATEALEHWNIAVAKGPLNAQIFAGQDLAKNVADAAKVVQDELGRIGFDTVTRALDLLRQHTVLGDAAFNQWAKDIGLSSVTIAVLREQVQAEDQAQKGAEQATRKHSAELKQQATEAARLAEQMDHLRGRIDALNSANAHFLPPVAYDPLKGNVPGIKPYVDALQHMPPVHIATTIDAPSIEAAIAGAGALGVERIGVVLEKTVYTKGLSAFGRITQGIPQLLQQAFTGGGGFKGFAQALSSQIGEAFGGKLFTAGGPLNGVGNKLAGLFGDSFGLALPDITQALGALVGPVLGKLWGVLKDAFGGPSKQELEGREVVRQFESRFSSPEEMINRVGAAYVAHGKKAEDAQAAIQRLWADEKLGAEATRQALAEINAELDRQSEISDAIHAQGFQSQDEIRHQAEIANAAYEAMASQMYDEATHTGQFTEHQVTQAYHHYQELLAQLEGDAGEAARAWLKVHDAAAAGVAGPVSALQSQMQQLRQSIANEAPEAVKGVIETQVEGQIAALAAQMKDQQEALTRASEQAAQTSTENMSDATDQITNDFGIAADDIILQFDDAADRFHNGFTDAADSAARAIRGIIGDIDLTIPVHFTVDPLNLPSPSPGPTPLVMDEGGYGRTTGPTWFYSGGNEDWAFSGEGKTFATGVAPPMRAPSQPGTVVHMVVNAVDAESFKSLADRHAVVIAKAALQGIQANGKAFNTYRTVTKQAVR